MDTGLGDCYRAAGRLLMNSHFNRRPPFLPEGEIILVHGRPTLTIEPFAKYDHAWLEVGEFCIDAERELIFPKILFYLVGKVDPKECSYYNYEQFRVFIAVSEHWGPWEDSELLTIAKNRGNLEK